MAFSRFRAGAPGASSRRPRITRASRDIRDLDAFPHPPRCAACRHRREACRPGLELLRRLRQALAAADAVTADGFEMSGAARTPCGDGVCPLTFHMSKQAIYVFGDVECPDRARDLIAFADGLVGAATGAEADVPRACEVDRAAEPGPAAICVAAPLGPLSPANNNLPRRIQAMRHDRKE